MSNKNNYFTYLNTLNQDNKKSLYKLISNNKSDKENKYFNINDIIKYRKISNNNAFFEQENIAKENINFFSKAENKVKENEIEKIIEEYECNLGIKKYDMNPQADEIFDVEGKWSGIVKEVKNDTFVAIIQDLNDPSNPQEQIEVEFDEIPECDIPKVKEGSQFYWYIGYIYRNSRKRRASEFIFRQIPQLKQKDIEKADKDADEISKFFSKK